MEQSERVGWTEHALKPLLSSFYFLYSGNVKRLKEIYKIKYYMESQKGADENNLWFGRKTAISLHKKIQVMYNRKVIRDNDQHLLLVQWNQLLPHSEWGHLQLQF